MARGTPPLAAPNQAGATLGLLVATNARPRFGGYILVALVVAWVVGIALRGVAPLDGWRWLALAAGAGMVGLGAGVAEMALRRRMKTAVGVAVWVGWLAAVGTLGCCLALGAARAAFADPASAPTAIGRVANGETLRVRGLVVTEPDLRVKGRLLTVEVMGFSRDGGRTWQTATGRVEALVAGPDDWFAPAYGDTAQLTGALLPNGGYAAPGVLARMPLARARIEARGGGSPVLAWLFDLRVRLAQGIEGALPEPEAALLIGILLGLKTPALRTRLGVFTATGTIHLVVPAGLKVATLAELATRAVRRLGPWPRTVAALLAVSVYAGLGGGGAAAVRAAIMGGLLALAPALGRTYNVFTALALAVGIMTALDPLVIFDAGFQLTTLATLGLPLLTPPIQRWLARWLLRIRLPGAVAIAELLAVTMAAQVATAPVLALTFQQVSVVAPVANLLTVPLLAPLLVMGGALAGLAALGGVAGVGALALAWLVWPLLWFVDRVIEGCAALPLAAVTIVNGGAWLAWVYYLALVAGVWLALRHGRVGAQDAVMARGERGGRTHTSLSRRLLAATLALALLGAMGASAPALADGTMGVARLDFLAVGPGGEATLLRLPSGMTLLLDGGPSGPTLEAQLASRIPFWRRQLDVVALTDTRAGDARGLEDAALHFRVVNAVDAGMLHPGAEYLAWLDAMGRAGARYTRLSAGTTIRLDAATILRTLAPPQGLYPDGDGATPVSDDAIMRLETPGLSALFLGAADGYALDALVASSATLTADVVEVALPEGAPLTLDGPLGDALRAAHPRLVVVASAPVTPTARTAYHNAAIGWEESDAQVGDALSAQVVRLESGAVALSGGAQGWRLG